MRQSIESFTRQDGVHYVLRVKRYALPATAAGGAKAAYVLDSDRRKRSATAFPLTSASNFDQGEGAGAAK